MKRADVNTKEWLHDELSLHIAVRGKYLITAQWLIWNKEDLDDRRKNHGLAHGETTLELAVQGNLAEMAVP
jgi:hypothetical protein